MKKLGKYMAATALTIGSAAAFLGFGGVDSKVPHYLLKPLHCSQYAVNAARDNGVKYNRANAWDLADKNNLIANISDSDLEKLAEDGTLIPGKSLVTFYGDNSSARFDEKGNKRIVTHVALYTGKKDHHLTFAHQRGIWQEEITENSLLDLGYHARQVIAPKD